MWGKCNNFDMVFTRKPESLRNDIWTAVIYSNITSVLEKDGIVLSAVMCGIR
jgi:hypothetical protein